MMEGNSYSLDKRRHTLSSVLVDPAILRVVERSNDSQDNPDEQMISPLDHLWSKQHVDMIEKRLLLLEQTKERFEYRLCELESFHSPLSSSSSSLPHSQHTQDYYQEEREDEDSVTVDKEDFENEEESDDDSDDYKRKSNMLLPPMKPEERQPSRDIMHNDSGGAHDELKRLKKQYNALLHQIELKEKENRDFQTKYNDSLNRCKTIQQAYDKDRLKFKEKEMYWEQHVRNLETELLLYQPLKKTEKKRCYTQPEQQQQQQQQQKQLQPQLQQPPQKQPQQKQQKQQYQNQNQNQNQQQQYQHQKRSYQQIQKAQPFRNQQQQQQQQPLQHQQQPQPQSFQQQYPLQNQIHHLPYHHQQHHYQHQQQQQQHHQHQQQQHQIQQQQQKQTQMHKEKEETEEDMIVEENKEDDEENLFTNNNSNNKKEESTFQEEDGYLIFNTTNANGELIHCRVKIPSSTATSVRSSSPVMRRRPADFPWALVSPPTTRAGSPRPPFEHNTKKGLNPNAPEWNGNWKISPPHSTV